MRTYFIDERKEGRRDLIIEVELIDADTINRLPETMLDAIDLILADQKTTRHYTRSIRLCIANIPLSFSERVIWSLLTELSNSATIVSNHVMKICASWEARNLPWSDPENQMGAIAIREYLIRNPNGLGITDAFAILMLMFDMGHETWQREAVRACLKSSWGTEVDHSHLFFVRVFGNGGQESREFVGDLRGLFGSLHTHSQLKKVIDHMLNHQPEPITDLNSYNILIAGACGSDQSKRTAVMDYITRQLATRGKNLTEDSSYFDEVSIQQEAKWADERCDKYPNTTKLDSGFFKRVDGRWIPSN